MIVLFLFCLELLVCVALGWPIVAALLVGLVLFVGWALRQGYGLRAVGGMLWSGIRTAHRAPSTWKTPSSCLRRSFRGRSRAQCRWPRPARRSRVCWPRAIST